MGAALWVVWIFHLLYCFSLVVNLKYEWVNKVWFHFFQINLMFLSLPRINVIYTF